VDFTSASLRHALWAWRAGDACEGLSERDVCGKRCNVYLMFELSASERCCALRAAGVSLSTWPRVRRRNRG
jgi:hypothetical protein